ncbi:MAG: PilZ domain-containing protein [Armatimonadetes bacterium]|nr:PilZ domain-containing protein [Armatimonadota bacterium]MDW8027453.1 PilZ domain-containing protein [Armatimonadota bacterium]
MMEKNLLRRGQRIVLESVHDEKVQRNTFVVDFVLPQQIFLTPLTEGEVVSFYEPESCVRGYIPTPVRTYQFESKVIQSKRLPSPFVAIDVPKEIVPVQRRRFFRIHALHSVQMIPLSNNGEPLLDQPLEVYGTDINGGGVGLRVDLRKIPSSLQLREHQKLLMKISLPSIEKTFQNGLSFETVGEVVWIRQNGKTLRLGVAFTSIERRLQERIVAWCFAFQCKLIRMGLISDERSETR